VSSISLQEARWLAIEAQGLGRARPARRPGRAQLARLLDRLGTIQLDAVNVLARTQHLVSFSRLGPHDPATFRSLTGPGGPWFEYWGHAASLLPNELHPLFRWRMAQWRGEGDVVDERRAAWYRAHAAYIEAVFEEVGERGPLAASQLSDPRRRQGEWWDRRSDGRRALEYLFASGRLAAWRTASFERVYDLTERVLPEEVLQLPTPDRAEAHRALVQRAAGYLGVATAADLADYFWLRRSEVRTAVDELVGAGSLAPVHVQGWAQPAYLPAGARIRRPGRAHATLLSPFDSLIWARERTERLFGVRYRIEIYVPAPRRTHGYYVLPLLLGDSLVARLDLKSDRAGSTLLVQSAHLEPGQEPLDVAGAAADELAALARWLGLENVSVAGRGGFAPALRKAVRSAGG